MIISRRALLGGMSMFPLAAGLTGCAARAMGSPVVDAQSHAVGPHPNWNGTLDSGSGTPTQTSRAGYTAKVIAGWMTVPHQRVNSGLHSIRVKAVGRKEGGDVTVVFKGDIPDTPVSKPQLVFVTDPVSGKTHPEYVYEIKLDIGAFTAKRPNVNRVRIYADCRSSDPTICHRVLGIEDIPVGPNIPITGPFNPTFNPGAETTFGARGAANGQYGRDWDPAYIAYPESAAGDGAPTGTFYYEFSSDGRPASYGGASLVGWANAVAAAKGALAAGKTAGHLRCISPGLIECQDVTNGDGTPTRGYITVTHVPGAYFGRTAMPDQTPGGGSWNWKCGLRRVEWRGVTFDNANLGSIACSNGAPHWAHAVTWKDSLGRDRLVNGQPPPARGFVGTNTLSNPSYYTDNYFENGNSPFFAGAILDLNNTSNQTYGDMHTGNKVVHSAYDGVNTAAWFTTKRNAITFSGAVAATVKKTTSNSNYGNAILTLIINGVTTDIYLQELASQADLTAAGGTYKAWSWQDIATIATAKGATAVVNDTIGIQARFMDPFGPVSFSNASPLTIQSYVDVHADWYQTGLVENVIIANCVDGGGLSSQYSGALFMGGERDHLVENVIIDASHSTGGGPGSATGAEHVIWRNITVTGNPGISVGGAAGAHAGSETWNDDHSQLANCLFESFDFTASGRNGDGPAIVNNYASKGTFGGSGASGNFKGGNFADQLIDAIGRDYRPAGLAASHLVATLVDCPYDIFGNPRAPVDCAGAVAGRLTAKPNLPIFA